MLRERQTAELFEVTGGTVNTLALAADIALSHPRLESGATWLTTSAQRTNANVEAKLLLLTHAFDA